MEDSDANDHVWSKILHREITGKQKSERAHGITIVFVCSWSNNILTASFLLSYIIL